MDEVKKMGRPELRPSYQDRTQVEALSGFGLPQDQIAALVCGGIDADTLAKHFKQELIRGKAKANSKVGKTLFQKATEGDTSAMIWWTKTQMGWKETIRTESRTEHVVYDPRDWLAAQISAVTQAQIGVIEGESVVDQEVVVPLDETLVTTLSGNVVELPSKPMVADIVAESPSVEKESKEEGFIRTVDEVDSAQ